ncbi:MAG TPA: protein-export chaperone SecB [Rhodospirillales bacterium]|nr:protein-export chaperone SecB [Rhodospirillales bacterium]
MNESPIADPARGGNGGDGAPAEDSHAEQRPPLMINAQYVKDLSFEVPGAPGIFAQLQQRPPEIAIKVDVHARALEGNVFEVVLETRADCKSGEAVAFILELAYAGVFTLNVAPEDVRPMLLIECPRMLFPFARQILSSTTLNGGFLPLMLGPVDFAALYQRQTQSEDESVPAQPTLLA